MTSKKSKMPAGHTQRGTKMSVQINVWTPQYYRFLYKKMLEEIERLTKPPYWEWAEQWKKDILITLLMKSQEKDVYDMKKLRKKALEDLRKFR